MRMVGSEDVDMVDTELQGGLRCPLILLIMVFGKSGSKLSPRILRLSPRIEDTLRTFNLNWVKDHEDLRKNLPFYHANKLKPRLKFFTRLI